MSFGMYMVGYIILITGLAIAAHLLHVPPRWIGVGIICMMGLGILTRCHNNPSPRSAGVI